jgi:diaminopimelate epimerase
MPNVTMQPLKFWKMHGTGNDFVITEPEPGAGDRDWGALAQRVCDRHFGVGADGLILSLPSEVADRRMRMFNPDGSEAEMCGNGIRCFVKFAFDQGLVRSAGGTMTVETTPGVVHTQASFDESGAVEAVRTSMGRPTFAAQDVGARVEQSPPVLDLPLEAAGESLSLTLVSMGNPHAVAFIDAPPAGYDLARIGPAVERHELFANRTNFEIVQVIDRSHIAMRVWERGVGETLACGSGACAATVAARLHGRVDDDLEVRLPGGTLRIEWDGEGEAYLSGPAVRVFAGEWHGVPEGGTAG